MHPDLPVTNQLIRTWLLGNTAIRRSSGGFIVNDSIEGCQLDNPCSVASDDEAVALMSLS